MTSAWSAWFYFLIGAGGAGLAFWAGTRLWNAAPHARLLGAAVASGFFVFAAVSHHGHMQDYTWRLWIPLGGEDFVALLSAQTLLGLASARLTRKVQRLTVMVMAGILYLLVLVVVASPLFWRYGGAAALDGRPNADGILKQRMPFTCAPAAASMLLHRYGVKATEGELAQASRTTFLFGTNDYALALGMRHGAEDTPLRVKVMPGTVEESAQFPTPFIAGVNHPKWGAHEIVVESFDRDGVHLIDPFEGKREVVKREQWTTMWKGRAIGIQK